MSAAIGSELHHFLNCLWYGVVLFVIYDGLRIFRTTIRHTYWLIGLEDLIFWIWAAFYLFSHFFVDTYGAVRGYQILGVAVGGIFWEYGCGRFLTKKMIFCIRWLKFRAKRCKILMCMRSLKLQKKNKNRKCNSNSESVTGGQTMGEKYARKKSRKKSREKSRKTSREKSEKEPE